jgi:hypothetical protein
MLVLANLPTPTTPPYADEGRVIRKDGGALCPLHSNCFLTLPSNKEWLSTCINDFE